MKIKSGVWYWLAMGSFATGLLYSMGLEGTCPDTGHSLGRRVHHSNGADPAGNLLYAAGLLRRRSGEKAEQEDSPSAPEHREER